MSKRLVIVGAGGFGREIHSWVNTSPTWRARNEISEVVFVDDREPEVKVRASIISSLADYWPQDSDVVICAIGSPAVRRGVVATLMKRNAMMTTFVHDNAVLGDNVLLGQGAIVCPNAVLSSDVTIGNYVHINVGCGLGHDVTIGDFVTLSSSCNLTGGVAIEQGAFLATAVTVIPGKRIGVDSFIGVGSVVIKDVPPNVTVFGNPCVIIGKRPA